jgi:hypothetical protein
MWTSGAEGGPSIMEKKKIKEMTKEERAEYQREWYAKKTAKSNPDLHITIANCPDDLRDAIIAAIKESK